LDLDIDVLARWNLDSVAGVCFHLLESPRVWECVRVGGHIQVGAHRAVAVMAHFSPRLAARAFQNAGGFQRRSQWGATEACRLRQRSHALGPSTAVAPWPSLYGPRRRQLTPTLRG